jgi:hypothetical protein
MDENKIEVPASSSLSREKESRLDVSPSPPPLSNPERRERAQEWVVIFIIAASFGLPTLLAAFFMWREFVQHNPPFPAFQLQDIPIVFSPFIPLITLAIGYLFGERRK